MHCLLLIHLKLLSKHWVPLLVIRARLTLALQFYHQLSKCKHPPKFMPLNIIQSICNVFLRLFHRPVALQLVHSLPHCLLDHPVLLHLLCSFLISESISSNLLWCVWCILHTLSFNFQTRHFITACMVMYLPGI